MKKVKREDIDTLAELNRIRFELTEPDLSSIGMEFEEMDNSDNGKIGFVQYGIDYYDAGGKQHREMVSSSLKEAKEGLAKKRALAKQGVVVNQKIIFMEYSRKLLHK